MTPFCTSSSSTIIMLLLSGLKLLSLCDFSSALLFCLETASGSGTNLKGL